MAGALGILTGEGRNGKLSERQLAMVEEREKARKSGDYKAADRIRHELEADGVIIEDTKDGPKARKLN